MNIFSHIKGTVLKGAIFGVMIAIVGCTTTGTGKNTGALVRVDESNSTMGDYNDDVAVQAIMETGEVSISPQEVSNLLKKKRYHFNFDSSKLFPSDYQALDIQALHYTKGVGRNDNIVIDGHTDERGTRTYNLALGERRANAVRDYLVLKGVSKRRIEVVSYGFEKPLDRGHNTTAWRKNRRAEIKLAR